VKRFCQLLVADNGQVCLPFPEWNTGMLRECGNPLRSGWYLLGYTIPRITEKTGLTKRHSPPFSDIQRLPNTRLEDKFVVSQEAKCFSINAALPDFVKNLGESVPRGEL
jgi:hypothetical protein